MNAALSGPARRVAQVRPPESKSGPVRRTRAVASKQRILDGATGLFAEFGFAAVSIRDIAKACKVNVPSIYNFFGSKDALYQACYKSAFEVGAQALHKVVSEAVSPERLIVDFTSKLCEVLMYNHDFRRLLQREFLREERRKINVLTTHHFQNEFRMMTAAIAQLYGKRQAMERCFAIYGLALGLLQMRRIGELAGVDPSIAKTPGNLAAHVLQIVLPPSIRLQRRNGTVAH